MTAQTESKTKEKPPESRSAYTPRDWEAVERIDGRWEVRGHHDDCSEGIPLFPGEESEAKMAVAAPALYEALEAILEWRTSRMTYLEETASQWEAAGSEQEKLIATRVRSEYKGTAWLTLAEQARAALALVKGGQ